MTLGEIDIYATASVSHTAVAAELDFVCTWQVIPASWLCFMVFALVISLGLLNLLTGVFVHALMEIQRENEELRFGGEAPERE